MTTTTDDDDKPLRNIRDIRDHGEPSGTMANPVGLCTTATVTEHFRDQSEIRSARYLTHGTTTSPEGLWRAMCEFPIE